MVLLFSSKYHVKWSITWSHIWVFCMHYAPLVTFKGILKVHALGAVQTDINCCAWNHDIARMLKKILYIPFFQNKSLFKEGFQKEEESKESQTRINWSFFFWQRNHPIEPSKFKDIYFWWYLNMMIGTLGCHDSPDSVTKQFFRKHLHRLSKDFSITSNVLSTSRTRPTQPFQCAQGLFIAW